MVLDPTELRKGMGSNKTQLLEEQAVDLNGYSETAQSVAFTAWSVGTAWNLHTVPSFLKTRVPH